MDYAICCRYISAGDDRAVYFCAAIKPESHVSAVYGGGFHAFGQVKIATSSGFGMS